jgi:hypothetical protein
MLKVRFEGVEHRGRFKAAMSPAEGSDSTCEKCRDAAILRLTKLRPGLLATPPVRGKSAGM